MLAPDGNWDAQGELSLGTGGAQLVVGEAIRISNESSQPPANNNSNKLSSKH